MMVVLPSPLLLSVILSITMPKILLLEDDLNLRDTIVEELEEEGFSLTATDKTDEVIDLTYENKFDLYLFDVNVIGMNGFQLLEALREAGDETPTIFLTSKNKTQDVIEGFEMGASDYLKKPFDIDELIARMLRFLKTKKSYKISDTVSYFPENLEVVNKTNKILLNQKDAQILVPQKPYFYSNSCYINLDACILGLSLSLIINNIKVSHESK